MYPAFAERGVEILAISTDPVDGARDMAELYDLEFPVLADSDATVTSKYGVYNLLGDDVATPAVFIVDFDGTIRSRPGRDHSCLSY